jgi:uncharacterized membrane protein
VRWFQVLLYLSLLLDTLAIAFQDRSVVAGISERAIVFVALIQMFAIGFSAYLIWLAAERRKNWPRWVLTAWLTVSVLALVQIIGETGLQGDIAIDLTSSLLTAAGLYLSFTGDARGWFNA